MESPVQPAIPVTTPEGGQGSWFGYTLPVKAPACAVTIGLTSITFYPYQGLGIHPPQTLAPWGHHVRLSPCLSVPSWTASAGRTSRLWVASLLSKCNVPAITPSHQRVPAPKSQDRRSLNASPHQANDHRCAVSRHPSRNRCPRRSKGGRDAIVTCILPQPRQFVNPLISKPHRSPHKPLYERIHPYDNPVDEEKPTPPQRAV